MKIACPHCRAAFALDDKRVPAAGLSIKCPKCKQPFAVRRAKPGEEGQIVEGTPLAVPLPGGPRKAPATAPGLMASLPGVSAAARDEATSLDLPPAQAPRERAVPLPGGPDSVREPRPPGLASGPGAAQSVLALSAGEPRADAVPLPGAPREEPPASAGALVPPPPEPSYAAIEAASGWQGVQFPESAFSSSDGPAVPAPQADDPFANIDIEVPDEPSAASSIALDLPRAAPPAPMPAAPAPTEAAADDPFGLDLPMPPPALPAPSIAPLNPSSDPGLDFGFPEPARAPDGPPAPASGAKLLDFVEEGKSAPKPAPKPARPPPVIAPTGAVPAGAQAAEFAADDAAIAALADAPKEKKKEKKPKAPGVPLSVRLQRAREATRDALGPSLARIGSLRKSPKALGGAVAIVAVLVLLGFGIRAGATSAGLFWKNLWTSSGKQHNAAARDALGKAEKMLAEGSFSATRDALATAARTLAALPDDEDARSFFVLAASELRVGWGVSGGADWDQATRVVEKLKDKKLDAQRAIGAFALASKDYGKAKALLAPLGDAAEADGESVWLYSQALLRGGEAAHADQVLDGALRAHPSVKLLLLRGQVARARSKPDDALKYFEQALAKAPNSGRALVEVADGKLQAGDLAEAGALLDRALAPDVHSQLDASEDGHASMLRALLAERQHNGKEAELQFERASKLDASSAAIFAAYGQFRLQRRESDKAAKQFDLALALDDKNPETLGNAARAFLGANRYLDADRRIREALDKQPNDARLIFVSGKVAEVIGKTDEAVKEYERALTKKADLPEALIGLAQLELAAGDKEKAREHTEAAEKAPAADKSAYDLEGLTDLWLALGEPALAKADAAAAQALDPEDAYADFAMGRALAALGQLGPAKELYEKSLARIDGDPLMHYELGSLLRRQGDRPAARKELEKAVALDPKDSRFHARLGAVLVEQGEIELADAQLRQAVLMEDRNAEALYFLGRALIAEKKLSEAVDALKKGIEADPKDGQIDYQLGLAYAAGSQLIPAGESFERATVKDPHSADAWEQLGLTDAAQNLFSDAIAAFKKAVILEPERARVWAEIGDAELQQGNLDRAIENLQKSAALDGGQASVWSKLGIAFRDRACDSCKARAVASLEKAAQLAPKDPAAYRELGYIYKDDRKRNEAVAAFKRYLELKPDAPDAESVKDDIFYLQEEGKRTP